MYYGVTQLSSYDKDKILDDIISNVFYIFNIFDVYWTILLGNITDDFIIIVSPAPVQYSTVQYSIVQYSTVQYSNNS